eukprot:COSAG04_NODE_4005_length_2364_cov_2.867550_3_plen_169_part_00
MVFCNAGSVASVRAGRGGVHAACESRTRTVSFHHSKNHAFHSSCLSTCNVCSFRSIHDPSWLGREFQTRALKGARLCFCRHRHARAPPQRASAQPPRQHRAHTSAWASCLQARSRSKATHKPRAAPRFGASGTKRACRRPAPEVSGSTGAAACWARRTAAPTSCSPSR